MRIVCISDTHCREKKLTIPPGNMIIHSGDFTIRGSEHETRDFMKWFGALPHEHKVVIAGNHDLMFERDPERARSYVPKGVHYLEDSEVTIDGLRIYGCPWVPWEPAILRLAFNIDRGALNLKEKYEKIPDGLDILVTHGPPANDLGGMLAFFDLSKNKDVQLEVGDAQLYRQIMRARPRLSVCGHVHSGHGVREHEGIRFVNAAVLDEGYTPKYPPTIIELEKRAP